MASRRRHELSLGQKLQLIKASGGRSQRQLAPQFNVRKTQFQSILKRKAELLLVYEDNHGGSHINVPGNKGKSKTPTISHGSGFSVFDH